MASINSSNTTDSQCLFEQKVYEKYCVIPAVIIITILAFLNKRTRIKPKLCNGRPGLVLPVNFLGDNIKNRLSIALAFGDITSRIFQLFLKIVGFKVLLLSSLSFVELGYESYWEKAFKSVVWVLLYGIINFPVFACLMTDSVLVGAVCGLLYTLMRFIALMVLVFSCPSHYAKSLKGWNRVYQQSVLYENLPGLLCHLFLLIRFSRMLIRVLHQRYWRQRVAFVEVSTPVIAKRHDFIHIRLLLSNKMDERSSRNWYNRLMEKIYKSRPDFKFSTGIVSTLTVTVIFIYHMTISLVILTSFWSNLDIKLHQKIKQTDPQNYEQYVAWKIILNISDIVEVSLYLSTFCTTFFSIFMLIRFIKCHRDHVLKSYKTRKYFGNSPSRLVGRSLSYPGYQIAYVGWGYIVTLIYLFFISFLVGLCIKIMTWKRLLNLIESFILPVFTVPICVWLFQYLLGWFVFRERQFPDITINVNNNRLYCVMSFFFFFFNIFVGYVSSMIRTLKITLLGVIFVQRIDCTPLMMGYHKWDKGYMSYIGFLNVLKSFSHPVMLVFCQFLVDLRQSRNRFPTENDVFVGGTDSIHVIARDSGVNERRTSSRTVSKTALNRWLVAYTLLKNPVLQPFRKRNLRFKILKEIKPPLQGL